jgi:hypothetical protein
MMREEFKTKWIRVFCKDLSEEQMKEICVEGGQYANYLWHAFSFDKVPRLRGKRRIKTHF